MSGRGIIQEQVDLCLRERRRWWKLFRFPTELQRRYEQDKLIALIRETVFVSTIGIVLCDLFLITDFAENPRGFERSLIIRLGIFTPALMLTTWVAYRWRARFVREWMCFVSIALTGGCAFVTVEGVNATISALTQPGMLIVMLVGTLLLRVPLLFAAMTAAVLMLEDAFFLLRDPWLTGSQKMTCIFILFAFAGVSLLTRGRGELLERRSYLLRLREELRAEQFRKMNDDLADLSIRDALTGLVNRRGLNEHFERVWESVFRNGRAVSVIMVDIDKFKRLNDTYGHPFGDKVLADLGKCLKCTIRQGDDMVARYGGEEFLVLLPRADLSQACDTAERMRRKVCELTFLAPGKTPEETTPLSISASFGVASTAGSPGIEPLELIANADMAMYGAKRSGGNCVSWETAQVQGAADSVGETKQQ